MMNTENDVMIEADGLTKKYGPHTAVSDISFSCTKGEVVGFLGPNGAGKTTTMRMLTGYMPPHQGDAYIAGHHTISESMQARHKLGYLPETVPLYPEMSVEGYLEFIGRIRRIDNLWDRIDDVLQDVGLLDRAESYISSLSKGMRQRVGLAQALLHDPDVLILDEPTIGLDPAQIVEIRQIISDVGRKRTVLLSTHILAEVEQICSRVIMIFDGRIYADMSIDEIKSTGNLVSIRLANPAANTSELLERVSGVESIVQHGTNSFGLTVVDSDQVRPLVAETAVYNGWGLLEMTQENQSLETIFLTKMREAEAAGFADEQTAVILSTEEE
ncbi:MAG: ATP-binding cassette domain-containing protein [Chloroflexi bacterium]|nr:MAG: ATP-binding cassette domain-containing protein [Chloroflexota bacterium]